MGRRTAPLGPRVLACFPSAPARQPASKLFLLSLSVKIRVFQTMMVSCVHLTWGDTQTISEALICNVASQASW